MTREPDTDHICEPGGFYMNICAACKIEAARGLERRYEKYPNGAAAATNRRLAAERRALLSVGPMRVEDHYPSRSATATAGKKDDRTRVVPASAPAVAVPVFDDPAPY